MQHCPGVVWQNPGCGAAEMVQTHFPLGNRIHTFQGVQTRGICGYDDQTNAGGVCICCHQIVESRHSGIQRASSRPTSGS